jgi:hypothetical protein
MPWRISAAQDELVIQKDDREKQTIDAIENATMSGEEVS